jgi:hypothetical protein
MAGIFEKWQLDQPRPAPAHQQPLAREAAGGETTRARGLRADPSVALRVRLAAGRQVCSSAATEHAAQLARRLEAERAGAADTAPAGPGGLAGGAEAAGRASFSSHHLDAAIPYPRFQPPASHPAASHWPAPPARGVDARSPAWPWERGVNTMWHTLDRTLVSKIAGYLRERDAVRAAGACTQWRRAVLRRFAMSAVWTGRLSPGRVWH